MAWNPLSVNSPAKIATVNCEEDEELQIHHQSKNSPAPELKENSTYIDHKNSGHLLHLSPSSMPINKIFTHKGVSVVSDGGAVIIQNFLSTPRHVEFTPEYAYRHFFFTVPSNISDYPLGLVHEEIALSSEILGADSNTRCSIFIADWSRIDEIREFAFRSNPNLRSFYDSGRLEFRRGRSDNFIWSQDYGEPVHVREASSGEHSEFVSGSAVSNVMPFNSSELNTSFLEIPMAFDGGDLTTTFTREGESVVVIGPRTLEQTQLYYHSTHNYEISEDEIAAILRHAFSTDRAIIINAPPQTELPDTIFHIDQAFFFLPNGVAVMLDPDSISSGTPERDNIIRLLHHYRYQLTQAGFRVVTIPTSDHQITHYMSYTNVIPITRSDGNTLVIMPSFPNYSGSRAIEEEITRILGHEGVQVRFVPNTTFNGRGSSHCLTGPLE